MLWFSCPLAFAKPPMLSSSMIHKLRNFRQHASDVVTQFLEGRPGCFWLDNSGFAWRLWEVQMNPIWNALPKRFFGIGITPNLNKPEFELQFAWNEFKKKKKQVPWSLIHQMRLRIPSHTKTHTHRCHNGHTLRGGITAQVLSIETFGSFIDLQVPVCFLNGSGFPYTYPPLRIQSSCKMRIIDYILTRDEYKKNIRRDWRLCQRWC